MPKQEKIKTPSLYVNTERGVALLNLSHAYYKDTYSLVNSDELLEVVKLYLDSKNPNTTMTHLIMPRLNNMFKH